MPPSQVVILCKDLILKTKIKELLKSGSGEFEFLKKSLVELSQADTDLCDVIADLAALSTQDIAELGSLRKAQRVQRVLGFCSHVDVEKLQHAKECGFDVVIPRSKLESVIPQFIN